MSLKIINSHTQQFKCVEMCHKKSRWKTTSAFLCSEENRKIYRCQAANNLGIIKLSESEFIHFLYCIFIFFFTPFFDGCDNAEQAKIGGGLQNTKYYIKSWSAHTLYLSIYLYGHGPTTGAMALFILIKIFVDEIKPLSIPFVWMEQRCQLPQITPNWNDMCDAGVFCTRSMSGANEICVTYIYI